MGIPRLFAGASLLGLAVLPVLVVSAPAEELEFTAYLQSGAEFRFVLTDLKTGTTSNWVAIGAVFQGYAVRAFDRPAEALVIRRGEAEFRLPVKKEKVAEGQVMAARTVSHAYSFSAAGEPLVDGEPTTWVALEEFLRRLFATEKEVAINLQGTTHLDPKGREIESAAIKRIMALQIGIINEMKARQQPHALVSGALLPSRPQQ